MWSTRRQIYTDYQNRLSTKDSEKKIKPMKKVMEGFKKNTAAGTIEFSVNSSSCFLGYF